MTTTVTLLLVSSIFFCLGFLFAAIFSSRATAECMNEAHHYGFVEGWEACEKRLGKGKTVENSIERIKAKGA